MLYLAVALAFLGSGTPSRPALTPAQPDDTTRDQAAIEALEQQWLHAQDSTTLDRILAADFVHPVPSGDLLTKAQHIAWVVAHPRPASTEVAFTTLRVRIYGDVAIANGIVLARPAGQPPQKTVFTDVFVRRSGRWQAVNAQEKLLAGR